MSRDITKILFFLMLTVIAFGYADAGNVYIWTDKNGLKHYSNKKPSGATKNIRIEKELISSIKVSEPAIDKSQKEETEPEQNAIKKEKAEKNSAPEKMNDPDKNSYPENKTASEKIKKAKNLEKSRKKQIATASQIPEKIIAPTEDSGPRKDSMIQSKRLYAASARVISEKRIAKYNRERVSTFFKSLGKAYKKAKCYHMSKGRFYYAKSESRANKALRCKDRLCVDRILEQAELIKIIGDAYMNRPCPQSKIAELYYLKAEHAASRADNCQPSGYRTNDTNRQYRECIETRSAEARWLKDQGNMHFVCQ